MSPRTTTLQLGFGLGHVFLQAWHDWRSRPALPAPPTRLDFIAIASALPEAEALRRAHHGTALQPLADALAAQWPVGTRNLHRLGFDAGRVQLLLAPGEALQWLPQLRARVDYILIDDAPPAADPRPASHWLCKGLARLAAPGAELRAEYEAREAAITSELRDLYDLEQEVRQLTGLPPRDAELEPATPFPEEGKGGGPNAVAPTSRGPQTLATRPAQLIYSTSRPSADLILQEIALRRTSMRSLVSDLRVQQDRIERTPSTWPIRVGNRRISSRFGYRKDPFTKRLRYHSGTDIVAPVGTPIVATAKGRVIYSGRDSDYGNLVQIDHGDGIQTWYAHMHRRTVTAGDVIMRGQQIGTVGNTGRSTGPHLHYEVRLHGTTVNPEKYLGN